MTDPPDADDQHGSTSVGPQSDRELAYTSPRAFDAALKARMADVAKESPHSVGELRRQFGYDRLLSRIFIT